MDPPYIHRSRYVPISSSRPPPPPPNTNLFRPSIYHHQPTYLPSPTPHHAPPPPPAQPPPPQIFPPQPPAPPPQGQQLDHHHHNPPLLSQLVPPQKVSHNPQFTFNTNFSPNSNSTAHKQFLERSSDFVHRIPIDDDQQQQQHQHRQHLLADFDARPDRWDPRRNVPAHHPVVGNLDHRHQLNHRPMSPYRSVNKVKLELDASYRFRERYKNYAFEFEHKSGSSSNQRGEFVPHRSHFVSDSDRLNSSSYDKQHSSQFDGNELVRNNVRDGFFDRQVLRQRQSLIERGSNSENIGDGVRGFSGKREFCGLDTGRYVNNRGSRENSYEYNRTPRKQVPKKSAFLRIQKPSYRNRDDGELHYSGYEMKSGSYRGKEQFFFSDRKVGEEEEEREGSPVELDVSFKSNSLVAKAIVAPSCATVMFDTNLKPKMGNTGKIMASDRSCSSSQMSKPSGSGMTLPSCRVVVNNADGSDNRDLKQSEKEVAPSADNMSDNKLRPYSSSCNNSLTKITMEKSNGIVSDKLGSGVGTDKMSSLKVAKKKRVVKKVVKKTTNPAVCVSGSQPTKKLNEPVKAECSTCDAPVAAVRKTGVKPSKEKVTSAMPSGHLVDLHPCPNEVNILAGNDIVGGSPQGAVVSKEVSTDCDSHISSVSKIKRKRSGLIFPLSSSSREETKIDKGAVNTDNCLDVLHTTLNSDKNLTNSLNENTASDICSIEGANHQFCHNGHSLLPENSATKESSEILFSAGRNINSDLISLEKKERIEGVINTCSITNGMNTTTSFNNGLVSTQEKITSSEEPCKDQMSPSVKSSTVEGFPLGEISAFSIPEETGISKVSIYAGFSNQDGCSVSASDNFNVNSEEINLGAGDYNGKQLASNEFTVSLENVATEGFPNTKFSVVRGEEDMPSTTNKSKVMTSPSDLPEAMITDLSMGPAKAVGSAQCVDTTLNLSAKDFSRAEARVTSSLDVGVQSFSDGLDVLNGCDLTGGCFEAKLSDSSGILGTSSEKRKRRKVSGCHPGFSSTIVSEISEAPLTPDLCVSGVELPSNSNEGQIQTEEVVAISNMDTLCDSNLLPCSDGITVLPENSLARVSSEVAVSVSRDAFKVGDDGLKIEHPSAASFSASGKLEISNAPPCCPGGSESKQIGNGNSVIDGSNYNEVINREGSKTEKMGAVVVEKQVKVCSEATQFETPSEHQSRDLNQILPATDVESDGCLLEKGDLLSVSTYPALAADGDGVSTTNSNDEMMEFDSPSNMCSPEILSDVGVMSILNHETSSQISDDNACEIGKIPTEKPVLEGNSNLSAHTSPSECAKINLKLDYKPASGCLVAGRTTVLPSQDVKGTGHSFNPTSGETSGLKNQLSHTVSRIYPSRSSSVFSASRNTASSTRITKPRTWHRMESSSTSHVPGNNSSLHTVPPQSQLPKKIAKFQSMSYIRKGNSLVRKSAPVATLPQVSHGYRLNSSGEGESKKSTGSDSSADAIDPANFFRMGALNTPLERPRTPPLSAVVKVPNSTTNFAGDCTSSLLAEPRPSGCSETISDSQKFMESNEEPSSCNAPLKISETPVKFGSINSSEIQGGLDDGTLATSNAKRITYVKRKSNQLIAASNDCDLSVQNPDKTQALSSDGYYKRRKNQLIRTSLDSNISQTGTSIDGTLTSGGEKAPNDIFSRSFSKSRSYRVGEKIRKPLKFSLVWSLSSLQSSNDDDHSSYCQKVLPYLFPWKRAAYWRRFVQHSNSISNSSSLSAIGRKLLLLRKRDTVYTRSNHGFSLIKSTVLSVGGSSLKWSKSIENRSKKANEEATMAVAAVEKKKRQQNGAESFASEMKNRSHSSKNRIFRIGSVRYKMDSSRRTLQRISDDESSCSAAPNSETNARKSYIPRRLVIGNDEYVQIGNGNQLIRDPKKRARVLASEKVRWSLHTARLRLARKRTYCQFFTRFGKCNKDDRKCPYIHDPSKIAVCTKFLNGLCSNSDCKLTHKVIPERMPDCSYFLQGLCTNKNCAYRHVHVNPSASTCKGFLKGYCADGSECRKKHSHVCPTFESTGSCPLGSRCKLHHPKSRSKEKKSKRSKKQKRNHGRYFGSMLVEDSEPQIKMMSERHCVRDNGNLFHEGKLADYISLDFGNEEGRETNNASSEQTNIPDGDGSDLQFDDLDELIKPIRIMNRQESSFSPG